jgi:hypothetical protein
MNNTVKHSPLNPPEGDLKPERHYIPYGEWGTAFREKSPNGGADSGKPKIMVSFAV